MAGDAVSDFATSETLRRERSSSRLSEKDLQPLKFFPPKSEWLVVELKCAIFGGGVPFHEFQVSVVSSMFLVRIVGDPRQTVAMFQPFDRCE